MYLSRAWPVRRSPSRGSSRCPTTRRRSAATTSSLYGHGSTGLADQCAPSTAAGASSFDVDIDLDYQTFDDDDLVRVRARVHRLRGPRRSGRAPVPRRGRARRTACWTPGGPCGSSRSLYAGADTAVAGFSQGGHAALWAAQLAPEYTPEQPIFAGLIASAASEMPAAGPSRRRRPEPPGADGVDAARARRGPPGGAGRARRSVLTPAGQAARRVAHERLFAGRRRRSPAAVPVRRPDHRRAVRVAARRQHRRARSPPRRRCSCSTATATRTSRSPRVTPCSPACVPPARWSSAVSCRAPPTSAPSAAPPSRAASGSPASPTAPSNPSTPASPSFPQGICVAGDANPLWKSLDGARRREKPGPGPGVSARHNRLGRRTRSPR